MIAVINGIKEVGVEFIEKYLAHLRSEGSVRIRVDWTSVVVSSWVTKFCE
ncbi:MAG TPA: hypothetical protein VNO35_01125 [Steroidobacteraceae bacterium]|nr:hypothetical protein [Steroidobacteraceae bacterium]